MTCFLWVRDTPCADTTCPRYVTCVCRNLHVSGCNFNPACLGRSSTCCKLSRCSSMDLPTTTISSMYTRQLFQCRPARTESINRWNVAGALHNPNGITLNSKSPSGIQNAVFSRSATQFCYQLPHVLTGFPYMCVCVLIYRKSVDYLCYCITDSKEVYISITTITSIIDLHEELANNFWIDHSNILTQYLLYNA